MLWEYIDDESNELMLRMRSQVAADGFHKMSREKNTAVETLSLKIISAAMIKTLAVMCEERGHMNVMQAYIHMAPMHADLMKSFLLKEAGL